MDYFKKIFKESIVIVLISSIIGLFSGTILSSSEEILYSFPIILLLLPALNSLIGDIATVLVSRLTTHLFIGSISPKIEKSNRLIEDFYGLLLTLCISIFSLLGIGYLFAYFTNVQIVNPTLIITILILTMIILFLFLFVFLFISSIYLFNKGKDPNNFLIPIITSLADFLSPTLIILFIILFT
ncbi:MAG: hypothetical protein GF317_09225 [Candidatus Lokiarchaeota archaeon]|nr:hypothetical protein [Candidatus Lokiarchaeota archaeon]MBD3199892.1 hypothetical protein [Candidatus Lokiarchaeota archaeon]